MTWGEWINTKYNQLGLYSTGLASYYIRNSELQLYTASRGIIKEYDIINNNANYILDAPTEHHGGGTN